MKIYTTDEEARECFRSSGLTYADLTESTVRMLEGRIAEALILAGTEGEEGTAPQCIMTIGPTMVGRHCVSLNVSSFYFERREAVTIWDSGRISFASWAASRNCEPIKQAFMAWCEEVSRMKGNGLLSDRTDEKWCDHLDRKTVYLLYTEDEGEFNDRVLQGIYSTREKAVNCAHDIHGFYMGEGRDDDLSYHLTEWDVGSNDETGTQDITEEVTGVKE